MLVYFWRCRSDATTEADAGVHILALEPRRGPPALPVDISLSVACRAARRGNLCHLLLRCGRLGALLPRDLAACRNACGRARIRVLESRRGPVTAPGQNSPPAALEASRGPRGAGIRGVLWRLRLATVVAGAASAFSCFWLGFGVERHLAQHGALASLMHEVGPGLVVILPDGCHDRDGRSADPAVAGQAGAAHSVPADGHGLDSFAGCQETAQEPRRGPRMRRW